MPKVRWLRWTAWAVLMGMLVVLGVGIYQSQPHEPRWQTAQKTLTPDEEAGVIHSVRYTPDGARVITYATQKEMAVSLTTVVPEVLEPWSIAVWDRETGKKLARYPTSGRFAFSPPVFSNGLRYCAGHILRANNGEEDRYSILVVDLVDARELTIPVTERPDDTVLVFSPDAGIFVRSGLPQQATSTPLSIYDRATGKLLDSRPGHQLFQPITADYLVHVNDENAEETVVELWSLATRKPAATLRKPGWTAKGLSRDRRALILSKPAPNEMAKEEWARWDLAARQFKIDPTAWCECSDDVSPDGKWVGEPDIGKYHMREAGTGDVKGTAEVPMAMDQPIFSPDSKFLLVPRRTTWEWGLPMPRMIGLAPAPEPADALSVFAVPSMELRWKKRWDDHCSALSFSQDGKTIYAAFRSDPAVHVLDLESGEPRGAIDMPCCGTTTIEPTPNRRYLRIHRDNSGVMEAGQTLPEVVLDWIRSFFPQPGHTCETIVVYDTVSNRERFRLTGWQCSGAVLSDDATSLITWHSEGGGDVMRCWDVGWKPLHWAIGIPAALGVVLVALALGYGRWRWRRADSASKPDSAPRTAV